jgi:hypothetical protein
MGKITRAKRALTALDGPRSAVVETVGLSFRRANLSAYSKGLD